MGFEVLGVLMTMKRAYGAYPIRCTIYTTLGVLVTFIPLTSISSKVLSVKYIWRGSLYLEIRDCIQHVYKIKIKGGEKREVTLEGE